MEHIDLDIEVLAQSIWDAMFDHSLRLERGGEVGSAPFVTSFVAINGAWTGGVLSQFPQLLASRLTATLFESDAVPDPGEIRDAVGEIGNIFAGNIKALVPEPSSLSLPAVALGTDYAVSIVGSRTIAQVNFTCAGHTFTISVVEGLDDGAVGR